MSESVKAETTTLDCLKQFSSVSGIGKSDKTKVELRKKVSQLLGVNEGTGRRWFTSKLLPKGDKLLRLRLFLEIVGYTPSEREKLSDSVRRLGDALALQVVSLKQVSTYTGISADSILRWMTASTKPRSDVEEVIKTFLELHYRPICEARGKWWQAAEGLGLVSVSTPEATTAVLEYPSTNKSNGSFRGQMIDSLAYLILAAKPLAEQLLSDDFTAEEREKLRQKTVVVRRDGVFDLANMLNRLCSERARNELSQ